MFAGELVKDIFFNAVSAGRVQECSNPDCAVSTRSDTGICAVCTVIARAADRAMRGEAAPEIFFATGKGGRPKNYGRPK